MHLPLNVFLFFLLCFLCYLFNLLQSPRLVSFVHQCVLFYLYHLLLPPHCKEIPIYVFLEKELRGLSPNFYIHVSVSDLYIPTIGPPIYLQQNMHTDRGNI